MDNPEIAWLNNQITAATQGDDNAFTQLVDKFQTPVFNLCYRMLGDYAEAEDAAQESFWRAYQSLMRYDHKRPFTTWLLSITAHFCIDQLRKRHFTTLPMDILPEEEAPDPAPNPETCITKAEENRAVRLLLSKLGPQDRAAIILRYWYDLSEEEIASTLSLTVSAVKSRLHRSRLELAHLWRVRQIPDIQGTRRPHESPVI